jgi:hypothetical protein
VRLQSSCFTGSALKLMMRPNVKRRHGFRGRGARPRVYLEGCCDASPHNPKPAVGHCFIETWLAGIFRQRRVISSPCPIRVAFNDRPEIKEKIQQQFVAEQTARVRKNGSVLRDGQIAGKALAQDAPRLGRRIFHT